MRCTYPARSESNIMAYFNNSFTFFKSAYYVLFFLSNDCSQGDRGGTVVKVLCYKSEDHWFDPGWCHWNFSLT